MKNNTISMDQKKVLVTGAGGFIGSHLTEKLVELGADVRALVHYNSLGRCGWLDSSPLRSGIRIIAGDITDRDCMVAAMKDRELVFHLASLIAIPYSYRAPESYVHTNIGGALTIMQAARDLGSVKVIHTSTSEVYGSAQYTPIDEKHPLVGQSPYSASKIGADKMVESFHLAFGVPAVTVRPFNTFGPRQSQRAVVPTIILQCMQGNEIHLGSVLPTRDLNYIEDTVDGFIRAACFDEALGRTINLGSGAEVSIASLAHLIGRLMDREVKITSDDARLRPEKSEVERLLADASLAKEIIQWQPQFSLEDGLTRTIDWFRKNHHRYLANEYVL